MTPNLPEAPERLPVPVTDAHTHLDSTIDRTGLTAAELVERAAAVGVHRLVDVGCDVPSCEAAVAFAGQFDGVVAALAIHPHDAVELGDGLDEALRHVEKLLDSSDRVRGVGETGLDHYWVTDEAGRAVQREAFAAHIGWAKQRGLALVIHDRDAHDDVLDVLDAEGWPERVQLHCFSGDAAFARRCLAHDAFLSFAGTVTFKANDALREAARITPRDRLLVETDAPYLTPVPVRGRPNASYLVAHTVRFLAELRDEPLEDVCAALDANATALFGAWGASAEPGGALRG